MPAHLLIAAPGSLMEAYTVVETEIPDLVLVCAGILRAAGNRHVRRDDRGFWALRCCGSRRPDRQCRQPVDRGGRPITPPARPPSRARGCCHRAALIRRPLPRGRCRDRAAVIVIGASTGGVEALHRILAEFPADCPPALVVQHIRGAFSARVRRTPEPGLPRRSGRGVDRASAAIRADPDRSWRRRASGDFAAAGAAVPADPRPRR